MDFFHERDLKINYKYNCWWCGLGIEKNPIRIQNRKFCSDECCILARETVKDIKNRFWDKVNKTENCWIWTAAENAGYGIIRIDYTNIRTHVLAWEWASGYKPPKGMVVGHTCDIRSCVRNDDEGVYIVNGVELPRFGHLFLGTYENNSQDAVNKGLYTPRGPTKIKRILK